MQGKILNYSIEQQSGVISGNDGKRYNFSNTEWKDDKAPILGALVDFNPQDTQAVDIYAIAPQYSQSKTSGFAIASLVLSILWIYALGSILAIIFGHISRSQIKASNGQISGSGLALAGLIIGYIGLVVVVLGIVAAVAIPQLANI